MSDHLPLYLELNKRVYIQKTKKFRFENMWIREDQCYKLVHNSWNQVEGRNIVDKMEYLSMQLEEYGGGRMKELRKKIQNLRRDMKKFRPRRDAVMANQLKQCLPMLISEKQSVFVEGRLLTDNVWIAFEINHYIRRRTHGSNGVVRFKIDVSKDGEEFGDSIPHRGIRQGDSISPYLYILCYEGLSSIIRRYEEVGLIHGISIARGAPCQAINLRKLYVVFNPNTRATDRALVFAILQVNEVSMRGNYLGLTMFISKRKNSVFGLLAERVSNKLHGWENNTISKGGKLVLLKTASLTIPNFWMNLFQIPGEVCTRMQWSMNYFWWGNSGSGKGIRWLSWDKLCDAKTGGWLGFRELSKFNVAMLEKQGWRLLNNENSLVTSILKARCFPKSDFPNAKLGSNLSYMWRSVMEAQDIVKEGSRRRIGNGEST
ncbi:uncharacterized protein LOC141680055 [Apium graveolens]|uniref:uncharacterized protein LOC141680055 n=1 Tax=Apium graveolens TaxID=4045 RepID=UPI003D799B4F